MSVSIILRGEPVPTTTTEAHTGTYVVMGMGNNLGMTSEMGCAVNTMRGCEWVYAYPLQDDGKSVALEPIISFVPGPISDHCDIPNILENEIEIVR